MRICIRPCSPHSPTKKLGKWGSANLSPSSNSRSIDFSVPGSAPVGVSSEGLYGAAGNCGHIPMDLIINNSGSVSFSRLARSSYHVRRTAGPV